MKRKLWKSDNEWGADCGKNNSDFVKFVADMFFTVDSAIWPRSKKYRGSKL